MEKKLKISGGGKRKEGLQVFDTVTRMTGGQSQKVGYVGQLFQGDVNSKVQWS